MNSANAPRLLLKDPLIHFLFIGALIYAAYGLLNDSEEEASPSTITVTQGEIQSLTEQWTRLWNRPPTEAELADVLRKHVRTRVLYKEAVAMGLDKDDVVIERRLAQKIELLSRSLVVPDPPSEEVLAAWYAENSLQFSTPRTFTISQVFFDPDRRGDQAGADAARALAALSRMDEVPGDLGSYGDSTIASNYYAARGAVELQKIFGSGFVERLPSLEPGRWHGGVLSGFGQHLVYVHSVTEPIAPPLEQVREQAQEAWMLAQVERRSAEFIDELIARYDIVVEATEVSMTVPPARTGD